MKKRAILIDGNNLLFRSYYATAYNGNLMKNSKDFPTNALYGFVNMINKILNEENPEYIMVAFDKGKNFRHDKYENYKAGRIETPNDLLKQFPYAYQILEAMGITALNLENYEADDIIGTFARMADENDLYDATIISSDKDLLQLISKEVNVKLLKQSGYILMNTEVFRETYKCDPIKMIDLKALMGDASDNIPGVKGIGEKTAINLISEYGSLEEVYNNIDNIKGKTREKLEIDKDNAFFSKDLATICKNAPIGLSFEDIKIKPRNEEELMSIYEELEFFSFIKKEGKKEVKEKVEYEIVNDKINPKDNFAFYIEVSEENYHESDILGMSIYDGEKVYILDKESILLNKDIFSKAYSTYDLKKNIVVLNKLGIDIENVRIDTMISAYLLNYNVKEDISYVSNTKNYNIEFYANMIKKGIIQDKDIFNYNLALKSKFIYETIDEFTTELDNEDMLHLFKDIEMPLVRVLAKMEMNGIRVDTDTLDTIKGKLEEKLNVLSSKIYDLAGIEFNISSPKQLGEILFEKINLPHKAKKGRNGYSTNHDTLMKLYDLHPIIPLILEYRNLIKLMTTYMDNLKDYVMSDSKIHTIFKQATTRTGRLSSAEPNLQNIPIRTEEGKEIRKAFLPEKDSVILTSDYSQIELRILAHISGCKNLISAFNNSEDIHTKVASDIYGVDTSLVTKTMRRTAKAVIFGIVYGISGFGLGENLDISPKEAKKYIDKYLTMYPGVKEYMDNIKRKAKEQGYVRTIMNRKREIDELKNTNYIIVKSGERMAMNTPIQGSAADIIKKAMIDVDNEMTKKGLKSKMLIQVHDELVFTVPKNEIEIMKELVRDTMENAYNLEVPLKVDVELGSNWYDAK
mgnify:CR=1 FL=1